MTSDALSYDVTSLDVFVFAILGPVCQQYDILSQNLLSVLLCCVYGGVVGTSGVGRLTPHTTNAVITYCGR